MQHEKGKRVGVRGQRELERTVHMLQELKQKYYNNKNVVPEHYLSV